MNFQTGLYKPLQEEDHALGFIEAKGAVHRLPVDIVDRCIGCEFCASVCQAPLTNSGTQCLRNTLPTRDRNDINTFEEQHRRRFTTVYVVVTHRGFGETNWVTFARKRHERRETIPVGKQSFSFADMVVIAHMLPKHATQRTPCRSVLRYSSPDNEGS
ncbi:hypothetical protein SAMN05444168_6022 [Paraburkholderia phenazinium]|uniref:4Fe-4S ferredoxin-type domain-containing protein n=1 Tax=Paraburkholderia phenazinium TaxID=60549 RepID=A0A1N6JX19_9BURK|nr:hypothetical protein SAMN05444168_5289 [Paraburkholderia phenazinium]SIO51528.1 hypothetical protein SAMN05444168_6022 [Paraburkholderia phenazinium]